MLAGATGIAGKVHERKFYGEAVHMVRYNKFLGELGIDWTGRRVLMSHIGNKHDTQPRIAGFCKAVGKTEEKKQNGTKQKEPGRPKSGRQGSR
jgi:hypothetical protein